MKNSPIKPVAPEEAAYHQKLLKFVPVFSVCIVLLFFSLLAFLEYYPPLTEKFHRATNEPILDCAVLYLPDGEKWKLPVDSRTKEDIVRLFQSVDNVTKTNRKPVPGNSYIEFGVNKWFFYPAGFTMNLSMFTNDKLYTCDDYEAFYEKLCEMCREFRY